MTTETLMTQTAMTTEDQSASTTAIQSAMNVDESSQSQQPTQKQENKGAQDQQPQSTAKNENNETKPQDTPKQYEFQAPEGVAFDAGVISAYAEMAKELDLPQEKAQRVLDKMLPVMQTRQTEQLGEFYADIGGLPDTWAASSTTDKEFGGDKLQENLAVAKKARDAFATPELTTLLNKTGLGNHPEIIRMFYRTGLAISEDHLVVGTAGKPSSKGDARRLYAASNMNP